MRRLLVALCLVGGQPLAAAPKPPVVLEPSSPWSLRTTDENCRLTRMFGAGESETIIRLDRFKPGEGTVVLIAGPILSQIERGRARLRFGPDGAEITYLLGGSVGALKAGRLYLG